MKKGEQPITEAVDEIKSGTRNKYKEHVSEVVDWSHSEKRGDNKIITEPIPCFKIVGPRNPTLSSSNLDENKILPYWQRTIIQLLVTEHDASK